MDGDIWDSRDLELLQKHVNWRTTFGGKATIKMQITSINLEVNMIGVECVKICPEMGVEGLGGSGGLCCILSIKRSSFHIDCVSIESM